MNLTIGENQYSTTGNLDAFSQLHIARKLAGALPIIEGMLSEANAAKDKALLTVLMFGQLNDSDTEFVVKKCLTVVTRKQPTGFVKVQSPSGALMFDDIKMGEMLKLTIEVIEENLGDFFRTSLASINPETEQTSS